MSSTPEGSPLHHGAHAAFLTLRLLDHWMSLGADMANPEVPANRAAREATNQLAGDDEIRMALTSVLVAIDALHEPDAQPLLPRVFALGKLLEQRGQIAQATDVYMTVTRYVDLSAHIDLAFDAHMRQGFCLRVSGEFDWADQSYATAASLAARARDRVRVIHARAGQAKVEWARGNLPAADEAMQQLADEAEKLDANRVLAMVLHDRSGIARHRGDLQRAIRYAFESFRRTTDRFERERVLMDLAGFLVQVNATESAGDALKLLEISGRSQEIRWSAQIGLMELAAKTGSETTFESYRRRLEGEPLPAVARTSYLLDAGRGLTAFGHFSSARRTLRAALTAAEESGQNQRIFEIEAALSAVDVAERSVESVTQYRPEPIEAPDDIATALHDLLHEEAGVY